MNWVRRRRLTAKRGGYELFWDMAAFADSHPDRQDRGYTYGVKWLGIDRSSWMVEWHRDTGDLTMTRPFRGEHGSPRGVHPWDGPGGHRYDVVLLATGHPRREIDRLLDRYWSHTGDHTSDVIQKYEAGQAGFDDIALEAAFPSLAGDASEGVPWLLARFPHTVHGPGVTSCAEWEAGIGDSWWDWVDNGVPTPAEAARWKALRISPSTARDFARKGLDIDLVESWRATAPAEISPENEWVIELAARLGVSGAQAAAALPLTRSWGWSGPADPVWVAAAQAKLPGSADEVVRLEAWVLAGVDDDVMVERFEQAGASPFGFATSGRSLEEYARWAEQGIHYGPEITSWERKGFDPPTAGVLDRAHPGRIRDLPEAGTGFGPDGLSRLSPEPPPEGPEVSPGE